MPFDIKGGVKIRLLDNLFLTPYVQYKNGGNNLKESQFFSLQTFGIGTGLAAENVISGLNLELDAAYVLTTKSHSTRPELGAGMRLKPEVTYNFSDSLLIATLFDDFNFLDDQHEKIDKEVVRKIINNEFNAEIVFNVFNLLKPGINSGLYTNFVSNTESARKKAPDGSWKQQDTTTVELGLGLITNPVDWFQAKTGFVASSSESLDDTTRNTSEVENKGWMFGVETTYKNFSFNADYMLYGKAEEDKKVEDTLFHKINMSVKYSF